MKYTYLINPKKIHIH